MSRATFTLYNFRILYVQEVDMGTASHELFSLNTPLQCSTMKITKTFFQIELDLFPVQPRVQTQLNISMLWICILMA